jgi:MFS family permease
MVTTLVELRGNPRACTYTEPMWGLSMALVLPYASVFMLALGLHDEQIGLLATVSVLSQMVFGLLSGVITDKLGRRTTTALFDVVAWVIPCLVWAVAQNFWFFLVASLVNGAWTVTQNSWDCLLVEDLDPRKITRVYSLIQVAGQFSALFAPIAAVLVAHLGLVPAVRILYVNAGVVMLAKLVLLYRFSTETAMGRVRMAATKGRSLWSLLGEYRSVLGLAVRTPGTVYALVIMALVAAVGVVTGTFWQVIVNTKLGVPDPLLPIFPMVRSILSVIFFFTITPRLLQSHHLRRPTIAGFVAYLGGQLLLVAIPASTGGATATTYAMLAGTLALDGFGAGILGMLAESLVALHIDTNERSRVMAIQRTCVMLVTAPFGWIGGWLSGMDRTLPFVLTSVLLAVGALVTTRFYARDRGATAAPASVDAR